MLLVWFLVISLVILFIFSMSREKGKNTKFARKEVKSNTQNRGPSQSIDTTEVIEIN